MFWKPVRSTQGRQGRLLQKEQRNRHDEDGIPVRQRYRMNGGKGSGFVRMTATEDYFKLN